MNRLSGPLSIVLLVILTITGTAYMAIEVLDIDPRRDHIEATIHMDRSGGLLDTSAVVLRGVKVGRVDDITLTGNGIDVRIRIDAARPIPANSVVRIANLSAAGEQYINFEPPGNAGPYLRDGGEIPSGQVRVGTTVGDMLGKVGALADQVDPVVMQSLADTFAIGFGDEAVMSNMRELAVILASTATDNREKLTRLFVNAQTVGENMRDIRFGDRLRELSPSLADLEPNFVHLIGSLHNYAEVGSEIWDQPIGPLVQKIKGYVDLLVPDFAFIATVLKPATSKLRPLRVNFGFITDIWGQIFPPGGPARIAVTMPQP